GTLRIPPKAREGFINVPVKGDHVVEGDETFSVRLTRPRGGSGPLADNTGIGTILNDDEPPTFPVVQVLYPNTGKEFLPIGVSAILRWRASDTIHPVVSQDLFISKNNGLTYVRIASGLPGTDSTYSWTPDSTLKTSQNGGPAYLARFKVIATNSQANNS